MNNELVSFFRFNESVENVVSRLNDMLDDESLHKQWFLSEVDRYKETWGTKNRYGSVDLRINKDEYIRLSERARASLESSKRHHIEIVFAKTKKSKDMTFILNISGSRKDEKFIKTYESFTKLLDGLISDYVNKKLQELGENPKNRSKLYEVLSKL